MRSMLTTQCPSISRSSWPPSSAVTTTWSSRARSTPRKRTRWAFTSSSTSTRPSAGSSTISRNCRTAGQRWPIAYNLSLHVTQLVQHPVFDVVIIACIVLVGIAVGAELEFKEEGGDDGAAQRLVQFCEVTQTVTLVVFVLEVVFKILARGLHPLDYFRDKEDGSFNTFDFTVVALSVMFEIGIGSDASIIAVARLLRLLKIMAKVPALRIILSGLTAGIHSVKSILMLLLLLIFLSSILCVTIFGYNAPYHFGNVQQSIVTLFQVSTLSGWHEVFQVAYFGCADYDMDVYRGASERVKVHTDMGGVGA